MIRRLTLPLRRWFLHKWLLLVNYRRADPFECCCGSSMENGCGGGFNCCRSAKEYAITCRLDALK